MKKILLGLFLIGLSFNNQAQDYNKWSIDFGGGVTEAIFPLTAGYSTNSPDFWQINFGARYMFNEKFGLRADLGFNKLGAGDNSLPFESDYYRATIEGVVNAGNLLNFRSWTNRFNLLFHGGVGYSQLSINSPQILSEGMLHFNLGFTPQVKITDRISLFADVSTLFHHFQDFTYDGQRNTAERQTNVSLFNASIGLNIAIGNKGQHADFYSVEEMDNVIVNTELDGIKKRLDEVEREVEILKTPNSDTNKEALVQELDSRYALKHTVVNKYSDVVSGSNVDFIKKLLNDGYVNVFFDTNKSTIQDGSLNSVNYLKQFMMDNPYVTAVLIGYADETGTGSRNQALSRNRAKRVYDMLVASGIRADRLSFIGGGEDKSVKAPARQFARKVTFKIN
jgi:OOP family OmpA-OmpF porin